MAEKDDTGQFHTCPACDINVTSIDRDYNYNLVGTCVTSGLPINVLIFYYASIWWVHVSYLPEIVAPETFAFKLN